METLPLVLQKNSDAITLLQRSKLLTLAVLLSSYGSLKSLLQPLYFHSKLWHYQSDVLITFPWCSVIWLELQYICSGDISSIGIRPDPRAAGSGLALPDYMTIHISQTRCHEINFHEINWHQINSHEMRSTQFFFWCFVLWNKRIMGQTPKSFDHAEAFLNSHTTNLNWCHNVSYQQIFTCQMIDLVKGSHFSVTGIFPMLPR